MIHDTTVLNYFSSLPVLAEIMRGVEHAGLQEQDEGHPLVVGVDRDVVLLLVVRVVTSALVRAHAGGRDVPADVPRQGPGQREGALDVAEGVDDRRGDGPAVRVALHGARDAVVIAWMIGGMSP